MALKPEQSKLANQIIKQHFGKVKMKELTNLLEQNGIFISEASIRLRASNLNVHGAY